MSKILFQHDINTKIVEIFYILNSKPLKYGLFLKLSASQFRLTMFQVFSNSAWPIGIVFDSVVLNIFTNKI